MLEPAILPATRDCASACITLLLIGRSLAGANLIRDVTAVPNTPPPPVVTHDATWRACVSQCHRVHVFFFITWHFNSRVVYLLHVIAVILILRWT